MATFVLLWRWFHDPAMCLPVPGRHGSGRRLAGSLIPDRTPWSAIGSSSKRGMRCRWGGARPDRSSRACSRRERAACAARLVREAEVPVSLPTPRRSCRTEKPGELSGRWRRSLDRLARVVYSGHPRNWQSPGFEGQAGSGQAAVDQVGPVLDLLQLALDETRSLMITCSIASTGSPVTQ